MTYRILTFAAQPCNGDSQRSPPASNLHLTMACASCGRTNPGAWFREEHPVRPFPAGMAEELEVTPELDPGHEDDWKDREQSVRRGRLSVDTAQEQVIGYLVRLRPFTPGSALSPFPDGGWFAQDTGARVPPRCPVGLPTDAADPEDD